MTRMHYTRWEMDRLKRDHFMLPPRSSEWPAKLDTGSAARLLAGTLGWAAALSLALVALVLAAGGAP